MNLYKYDKKYDKNFWDFKDLSSLLNKYVRKYESNYTFVHDFRMIRENSLKYEVFDGIKTLKKTPLN